MDKTNRSSRTSTVRDTRKKQWMPPSSLDAPPAPNGYKHRWIRTETMGQKDEEKDGNLLELKRLKIKLANMTIQ